MLKTFRLITSPSFEDGGEFFNLPRRDDGIQPSAAEGITPEELDRDNGDLSIVNTFVLVRVSSSLGRRSRPIHLSALLNPPLSTSWLIESVRLLVALQNGRLILPSARRHTIGCVGEFLNP